MRLTIRIISRLIVVAGLMISVWGSYPRAASSECDYCACFASGRETCDEDLDVCVTCDFGPYPCGCDTVCGFDFWCVVPN